MVYSIMFKLQFAVGAPCHIMIMCESLDKIKWKFTKHILLSFVNASVLIIYCQYTRALQNWKSLLIKDC